MKRLFATLAFFIALAVCTVSVQAQSDLGGQNCVRISGAHPNWRPGECLMAGDLNAAILASKQWINVQGKPPAITNFLNGLEPLGVGSGGTNCSVTNPTCLDNIAGWTNQVGFLYRNGPGSYTFSSTTLTPPTSITLGGVFSSTAPANQFAYGISTAGNALYRGIVSADLPAIPFSSLTAKPTTLSGFGITDALAAANNLSELANTNTARINLGLATIASSGSASDLSAGLVPLARGGLNLNLTTSGGTEQFLRQNTTGGQPAFVRPTCASLSNSSASCSTDATNAANIGSGTLPNARLPVPGAVTGLPANPSGTTSTTLVMMGMGGTCSVTMGRSGKVTFTINGNIQNSGGQGFGYQLRYGTGTAPTNGVAVTGTGPGSLHLDIPAGGAAVPFSDSATVTGLSAGTAYWFDEALEQFGGSGTPAITNTTCHALES